MLPYPMKYLPADTSDCIPSPDMLPGIRRLEGKKKNKGESTPTTTPMASELDIHTNVFPTSSPAGNRVNRIHDFAVQNDPDDDDSDSAPPPPPDSDAGFVQSKNGNVYSVVSAKKQSDNKSSNSSANLKSAQPGKGHKSSDSLSASHRKSKRPRSRLSRQLRLSMKSDTLIQHGASESLKDFDKEFRLEDLKDRLPDDAPAPDFITPTATPRDSVSTPRDEPSRSASPSKELRKHRRKSSAGVTAKKDVVFWWKIIREAKVPMHLVATENKLAETAQELRIILGELQIPCSDTFEDHSNNFKFPALENELSPEDVEKLIKKVRKKLGKAIMSHSPPAPDVKCSA
mmetsp:Transcript_5578/g.7764  ORF Transcript_5578/g.7764 Transcript_5578/m.7764 type:complete len:344 (-) Transcript_5578:63-1094(-)